MAKSAKRAKTSRGARSVKRTGAARSTRKTARSAKSSRRTTATRGTGRARGTKRKSTGRRPNAAFMRPVSPSPALSEVVGDKPIPRTEVTKRLWAYIRKNKLQDTKNRRMIRSDERLRPVFGGKSSVNMFEMTKLVNRHLK